MVNLATIQHPAAAIVSSQQGKEAATVGCVLFRSPFPVRKLVLCANSHMHRCLATGRKIIPPTTRCVSCRHHRQSNQLKTRGGSLVQGSKTTEMAGAEAEMQRYGILACTCLRSFFDFQPISHQCTNNATCVVAAHVERTRVMVPGPA